jgi:hypothetical protein
MTSGLLLQQFYVWHFVAQNIQHLYTQKDNRHVCNTNKAENEQNTIHSIKEELATNNALIVKADMGNSIVIYQQDYREKVMHFSSNNNFEILMTPPNNFIKPSTKLSTHVSFSYPKIYLGN